MEQNALNDFALVKVWNALILRESRCNFYTESKILMYAWTKKEATFYNGLILGGLGIFAVIVVLLSKFLAKV